LLLSVMCVMIVTRCLPKTHYVHIAHIVTYCCIFLWGSCFSKCVCVCVCVRVFIFSVVGNGKCHAIFWLAPSVTFSVCYSNIWGEFWDLSAVIINLYRVYLEVLHLSCPPLQNAKYSSLLDFITIFWYQLPCLFSPHKFFFFFFWVWLIKPYIWVALSVWWFCMILISGFSLPQYIDFCPASVETTGQSQEAKKKLSCFAWVLILVMPSPLWPLRKSKFCHHMWQVINSLESIILEVYNLGYIVNCNA